MFHPGSPFRPDPLSGSSDITPTGVDFRMPPHARTNFLRPKGGPEQTEQSVDRGASQALAIKTSSAIRHTLSQGFQKHLGEETPSAVSVAPGEGQEVSEPFSISDLRKRFLQELGITAITTEDPKQAVFARGQVRPMLPLVNTNKTSLYKRILEALKTTHHMTLPKLLQSHQKIALNDLRFLTYLFLRENSGWGGNGSIIEQQVAASDRTTLLSLLRSSRGN